MLKVAQTSGQVAFRGLLHSAQEGMPEALAVAPASTCYPLYTDLVASRLVRRGLKDRAGAQVTMGAFRGVDHGRVVCVLENINGLGALPGLIFILIFASPIAISLSLYQCYACSDFKVHVSIVCWTPW